jgi:hypothetical protein
MPLVSGSIHKFRQRGDAAGGQGWDQKEDEGEEAFIVHVGDPFRFTNPGGRNTATLLAVNLLLPERLR